MAGARLHCIFVLLLYSQGSYGQTALSNNQNIGVNNAIGLQQQNLQRTPRNFNPNENGAINNNLSQPPNFQANSQLSSSMSGTNQGNLQQQLNLPPTLQSQTSPQNNFQITKIGFTPVSPSIVGNPPISTQQLQNEGIQLNGQINTPASQMPNAPITVSNLAELAALKGQSLLSMLSPQNNCQSQQNQPIFQNCQNQLTDAQKQYLVRSLQGQNQQGINVVQTQPRVVNMDNQQAITIRAISQPQQGHAIVTPLGTQPAYITVQAQPIATYLQNQTPQVIAEEEPSILSLILSELGPQYAINTGYTPPKKGSKTNLKTLIPLIINLLKEKNCACRNCGCPNNYQNNDYSNVKPGSQMAQIIEGYSNQREYNQDSENSAARIKKNDNDKARNNDKERKNDVEKLVNNDSEEFSEEDDSEYIDDDE